MIVFSYVALDGRMLSVSGASPASLKNRRSADDWIDEHLWVACDEPDKTRIRSAFAECRLTGETQILEVSTHVSEIRERWLVYMERVPTGGVVRSSGRLLETMPSTISLRHRQIIWLLAHDLTADQIADRLDINHATINTHIRQIRSEIGVSTNAAIGAYAVMSGIYDGEFPGA